MSTPSHYWCEYAWLGSGPAAGVAIEVADGRFTAITAGVPTPAGRVVRLPGLTVAGLANAHSHAFHRALRGRTEAGYGTFWTWRDLMYRVAQRLEPDSYLRLARAVYAEMALAGVTCVGEFHYLHHAPGGGRYAEPNIMGTALLDAAGCAGIRITLLDACYLASTVDGRPLTGPQLRFGDVDAEAWATRLAALTHDAVSGPRAAAGPAQARIGAGRIGAGRAEARIGAAIHSVRAVPAAQAAIVARWADHAGLPLHVHLSEQRAENQACLAYHGRTPTEVLTDAGALGPRTTAVHATHLTDGDRTTLGDRGTTVCLCPTTERDLADGIPTARALSDAGSPLCLGSDSHAVVDLFEEARAMELHERLRTERRGAFSPASLMAAAGSAGHAALGWPDAGTITVGARADLVTVALDSVRTTGVAPDQFMFAATASDVRHVVVDGRVVVRDGTHVTIPDVAGELASAIAAVLP